MGRSLKYFNTSSNSLKSNTLWKLHHNNALNLSSTPSHVILSPTNETNTLNFTNLDDVGISTVKDSTAFKKIQFFSKTDPSQIFNTKSDFDSSFNKFSNLYNNDTLLNSSSNYSIDRQHNYASMSSTLPSYTTLLDLKSLDKMFSYNFNKSDRTVNNNLLNTNRYSYDSSSTSLRNDTNLYNYFKLFPQNLLNQTGVDFSIFMKIPNLFQILNNENDSKQFSNPFKFSLNFNHKKKSLTNLNSFFIDNNPSNLDYNTPVNNFSHSIYNTENLLKFKDLKSNNLQFLGSERTVRLLKNLNSNTYKWNISSSPNITSSVSANLLNFGSSLNDVYNSSLSN
jgi:hypothetical protein